MFQPSIDTENAGDWWQWDPAARQWLWLNGSTETNVTPVYGPLGAPTASATPGARSGHATTVSKSGAMYLMGGQRNLLIGMNYGNNSCCLYHHASFIPTIIQCSPC